VANTPIATLPYPALTDSPNGPSQVQSLATALDSQVVPRFATTAARDAAITAPAAGQMCWTTTPATHWYYSGSGWIILGGGAYGRCRLRRVANQSVLTNAATAISWDTEDVDSGGYITAPSTTITIPASLDGMYAITFRAAGATQPTNRNFAEINVTSALTGVPGDFRIPSTGGTAENRMVAYYSGPLAAGDTFVCNVLHNVGSAQNYVGWLSVVRLAPL
jgi:hypothetical protein